MDVQKINLHFASFAILLAAVFLLTSCGGAETTGLETDASTATEASSDPTPEEALATAVEQRGEPCDCVAENQEAMSGLLESLESSAGVTAQELNIQIANMILPCMKPAGNQMQDLEYSRAMGKCEQFKALTDVMLEVKTAVQVRVEEEAANAENREMGDAKGASDVLNKLKGN